MKNRKKGKKKKTGRKTKKKNVETNFISFSNKTTTLYYKNGRRAGLVFLHKFCQRQKKTREEEVAT